MFCMPASFDTPTAGIPMTSTWWGLSKPAYSVSTLNVTFITAPAGSIVLINPGESHTGGPGVPDGYVYRTFYASESLIRTVAAELGTTAILPSFRKPVITDQHLYDVLLAFNRSLADPASALEQETHLRHALSLLVSRYTEPGSSKWPLEGRVPRSPAGAAISRRELCARCFPIRTGHSLRL